jgi:hypothetical protein
MRFGRPWPPRPFRPASDLASGAARRRAKRELAGLCGPLPRILGHRRTGARAAVAAPAPTADDQQVGDDGQRAPRRPVGPAWAGGGGTRAVRAGRPDGGSSRCRRRGGVVGGVVELAGRRCRVRASRQRQGTGGQTEQTDPAHRAVPLGRLDHVAVRTEPGHRHPALGAVQVGRVDVVTVGADRWHAQSTLGAEPVAGSHLVAVGAPTWHPGSALGAEAVAGVDLMTIDAPSLHRQPAIGAVAIPRIHLVAVGAQTWHPGTAFGAEPVARMDLVPSHTVTGQARSALGAEPVARPHLVAVQAHGPSPHVDQGSQTPRQGDYIRVTPGPVRGGGLLGHAVGDGH